MKFIITKFSSTGFTVNFISKSDFDAIKIQLSHLRYSHQISITETNEESQLTFSHLDLENIGEAATFILNIFLEYDLCSYSEYEAISSVLSQLIELNIFTSLQTLIEQNITLESILLDEKLANDVDFLTKSAEIHAEEYSQVCSTLTSLPKHGNVFEENDISAMLISAANNSLSDMRNSLTRKLDLLQRRIAILNEKHISNISETARLNYVIRHTKPLTRHQLLDLVLLDEKESLQSFTLNNPDSKYKKIKFYINTTLSTDQRERENLKTNHINLLWGDAAPQTIIEAALQNGNKLFLEIEEGIVTRTELISLLAKNSARVERSAHMSGHRALGSSYFKNLAVYDQNPEIERDYEQIHREIKRKIELILRQQIAPINLIELYFVGCGKGAEIETIAAALEHLNFKYVILGVDIDEDNILAARSKTCFQNKNVFFACADANNIDELIQDFRAKHADLYLEQGSTISIAISSGFLTRVVNNSTVDAFEIFKKIAHFVNHIIISGRTCNLIAHHDAKNSGMKHTQHAFLSLGNVRLLDYYEWDTENPPKYINSVPKMIKLKDHARPLPLLYQLIHSDIYFSYEKIDLRGAYFSLDEVYQQQTALSFLHEIIKLNPKIKIISDGTEKWSIELRKITHKEMELLGHLCIETPNYRNVPAKEMGLFAHEREKISEKLTERAQKAKKI